MESGQQDEIRITYSSLNSIEYTYDNEIPAIPQYSNFNPKYSSKSKKQGRSKW